SLPGVVPILEAKVPIVGRVEPGDVPGAVERVHHLLGQGPLFEVVEVVPQLRDARHADDDAVVAALDPERGVVDQPPQRRLDHAEPGLFRRGLDGAQGLEGAAAEVARPVVGARHALVREAAGSRRHVPGLDRAGQETAGQRVVDHQVHAVAPQRGQQLGLDGARDGVVHALVHGRPHPAVVPARHDHLGHLERGKVAQAQLRKLALFVQLVQGRERFGEGSGAVLKADRITQLLQTRLNPLDNLVCRVHTRLQWIHDLGGHLEALFPPSRLARKGLLLPANISTRRVQLAVAAALEDIERLLEGVQVCDASAPLLFSSKGHQTQDDAVLGWSGHSGGRFLGAGEQEAC
ncbi:hypothetical protein PoMZ_06650, partial [Pyricularia oryzae]